MGGEDQLRALAIGQEIVPAGRHGLPHHPVPRAPERPVEQIGGRTLGPGRGFEGHEGAGQLECVHGMKAPRRRGARRGSWSRDSRDVLTPTELRAARGTSSALRSW